MNRFWLASRALLASLAWLAVSGCGDACSELQDMCDLCQDPNHKARCEASVDDDVQDVCEQHVESYEAICN